MDKENKDKHSDTGKKNDHNDGGQIPAPSMPPTRSSVALFVWVLIFVTIITLMIFKFRTPHQYEEWDQSRFEKELRDGHIMSSTVVPESDRIMYVEGEYVNESDTSEKRYYKARILFSESLAALLQKKTEVTIKVENPDTWWRSLIVTLLPILLIVGLLYFLFSRQIKMAGRGAMQFGKSKARMIFPDEGHKVTFEDIAGADEAKEETVEIIDYLKDPLKFKMVGGKIPRGALLMGPPGTGKTLLAKAVAGEANVPFFSISGSDFVEMFVGVGASRVRDMFEQARRCTPCLIFIDEIDAVGRSRFTGIGGGHDEREQTLNALLVEMDGLETQEGVIILAATNRPDVLDPALQRPGRFDRQIMLDLPDIAGREKILEVHVKNIKMDKDVDLGIIARGTPGFSGADLANLVNEAALLAGRFDREAATMDDMEEARDKVRWGRERRSKKISDRERKLTAYHEAGHALLTLYCPLATPLHKVTIIPRGTAFLGATMNLPRDDMYTQSKRELLDQVAVLMGGRIAEELIFNDVTSGAAADIEQATNICRMMVCKFGMSDLMGAVQYGRRAEHIYLGRDIVKSEPYSEVTAREIDLEIKKLVDGAGKRADTILRAHKNQLETLSQALLEKETLDVDTVKEIIGFKEEIEVSSQDSSSSVGS